MARDREIIITEFQIKSRPRNNWTFTAKLNDSASMGFFIITLVSLIGNDLVLNFLHFQNEYLLEEFFFFFSEIISTIVECHNSSQPIKL